MARPSPVPVERPVQNLSKMLPTSAAGIIGPSFSTQASSRSPSTRAPTSTRPPAGLQAIAVEPGGLAGEGRQPRPQRGQRALELVGDRGENGCLEPVRLFQVARAPGLESRHPAVQEKRAEAQEGSQQAALLPIGAGG